MKFSRILDNILNTQLLILTYNVKIEINNK